MTENVRHFSTRLSKLQNNRLPKSRITDWPKMCANFLLGCPNCNKSLPRIRITDWATICANFLLGCPNAEKLPSQTEIPIDRKCYQFSIRLSKAFLTNSAGYIAKIFVRTINNRPRRRVALYFHKNLLRYFRCFMKMINSFCKSTKIISKFALEYKNLVFKLKLNFISSS